MAAELIDSVMTLEFYAGLATGALAADVAKHIAKSRVRDVADVTGAEVDDRDDGSFEHR